MSSINRRSTRVVATFKKEPERLERQAALIEGASQLGLVSGRRNVGQVERSGRRVDVGVVLRAGLLEPGIVN